MQELKLKPTLLRTSCGFLRTYHETKMQALIDPAVLDSRTNPPENPLEPPHVTTCAAAAEEEEEEEDTCPGLSMRGGNGVAAAGTGATAAPAVHIV